MASWREFVWHLIPSDLDYDPSSFCLGLASFASIWVKMSGCFHCYYLIPELAISSKAELLLDLMPVCSSLVFVREHDLRLNAKLVETSHLKTWKTVDLTLIPNWRLCLSQRVVDAVRLTVRERQERLIGWVPTFDSWLLLNGLLTKQMLDSMHFTCQVLVISQISLSSQIFSLWMSHTISFVSFSSRKLAAPHCHILEIT
jgi:hypothetical protein